MINRDNYLDVQAHMEYRRRVTQNEEGTIRVTWLALKHLLIWADGLPFPEAPRKMPAFPEYLLTARNDGKEDPLTPKYMVKVLEHARSFFEWARKNRQPYQKITEAWIATLRVRRSRGMQSKLIIRQAWTLEDAIRVSTFQLPTDTLRYQRDQAAIAFLFLSGMRVSAFVTLPLECVDLSRRRIAQLPDYGVQTKNRKAAITFLLPIPELLQVVAAWDEKVRAVSQSARVAWYAKLDKTGLAITPDDVVTDDRCIHGRRMSLSQGMQELCNLAGVVYKSPHKLRHGHGLYGVKNARTVAELKAISQNLMHANLGITDGIYGNLPEADMAQVIESMAPGRLNNLSPFESFRQKG